MDTIFACRLCLATNVKLFDMYMCGLDVAYKKLTGYQMIPEDGMQFACSMCGALLRKSAAFLQACRRSHEALQRAHAQRHPITTEYIANLKIKSPYSNLTFNFNVDHQEVTSKTWDTWDSDHDYADVKGTDSGDEPLAKVALKKPRRKKLDYEDGNNKRKKKPTKVKIEKNNDDTTEPNELPTNNGIPDSNDTCPDIVKIEPDSDQQDFKPGEVDIFILTKEEQIQEVQARKTSLNYLNSFYKCDHCFKGFMTLATYKNHMARHDPASGAHACAACGTRWPSARALRSHAATAHERRFVCKLCDFVSKSRHRAKEHVKWHSGHLFLCKYCGASFSKSTSHLTHIRLHHPSQHTCGVCGEAFIGENGLNMHRKKAHRGLQEESKPLACCAHCDAQFLSADALQRHLRRGQPCDPALRPCQQCGEGFSAEEQLREHLKVHFKEEPVTCDQCSRTFAHERSYSVHRLRAHAGAPPARTQPPPVVCEVCGKKCISAATLRYHQRTHTGERPYQCADCPKTFTVFQRLQIHRRTHTGERPYACAHCPKAFKHKAALNRHDRVHSGAKPYACAHCGKAFSQSNSMKLHVRTVHLKMPSPYRARRGPE